MSIYNVVWNEDLSNINFDQETAFTICIQDPSFYCENSETCLICPLLSGDNPLPKSNPTAQDNSEKPQQENPLNQSTPGEKQTSRDITIYPGAKQLLTCTICRNTFKGKESLRKHIKSHANKVHKCKSCNFETHVKHIMVEHRLTHQKPILSNYLCDMCTFNTKKMINLQKHLARHTTEKKYKCDVCSYRTRNLYYLKRHIKNHNGERDLKCGFCEFETVHKSSFKDHMQRHLNGQKYECKICDFKTLSKGALNEHNKHHSTSFKRLLNEYTTKFNLRNKQGTTGL